MTNADVDDVDADPETDTQVHELMTVLIALHADALDAVVHDLDEIEMAHDLPAAGWSLHSAIRVAVAAYHPARTR